MAYQTVFERYEFKYLLTPRQESALERALEEHMLRDSHGRATIRNVYFDTPTYRLIRHSLEKPAYKEKLRLRAYHRPEAQEDVFIELKKKYRCVVYKRRLALASAVAEDCLLRGAPLPGDSQIAREIDYFRSYYGQLRPAAFLSYEREAFAACEGDLRMTLDRNILFRREDLRLDSEIYGAPLLEEGQALLEIKTGGGMPLWLTNVLTRERVFRTTFSKYGTGYCSFILGAQREAERYA